MTPNLIDNKADFDEFLASFRPKGFVSLDTEFLRRDTYFAKLALIQIEYNSTIYIFDALKLDLKSLWDKIIDSNVTIIIHSGRQDLEIIKRLYGRLPKNLFDTQIAAKYCGFRSATSYGELCSEICNIDLDKSHQSGDWTKRPLTESKMKYAGTDVEHLNNIYQYLIKIIEKKSLHDLVETGIIRELLDESLYENNLEEAWKKVKFQNKKKYFIKRMKVLAAFREEAAIELDIPRKFFLTDAQLIQICNFLPQDTKSLRRIRYLKKWILLPAYKEKLFNICQELEEKKELV